MMIMIIIVILNAMELTLASYPQDCKLKAGREDEKAATKEINDEP